MRSVMLGRGDNMAGCGVIGKQRRQPVISVLLLVTAGCEKRQGEWLTVTDDHEAIAEARELTGHLQDQEIATLLGHLDATWPVTAAISALKGKKGRCLDQFRQIAHGYEYTAKYNLGHDVPCGPYRSYEGRYNHPTISDKARGRFGSICERVYHHYHIRMGLEMPFTGHVVEKNRPER